MNLLALDTSSNACSVALLVDDDVIGNHVIKPREHTAILIPMIEDTLRQRDLSIDALDGIVLGNGPGSFIGMRIAASVAQGMAFGAGLKIAPVSSLAAIAAEVFERHDASRVVVAQDAHMSEVYLAVYDRGDQQVPIPRGDVRLHKTGEVFSDDFALSVTAGAGWQRYPELLDRNIGAFAGHTEVLHPNAEYLLRIGKQEWDEGNIIPPEDVVPEYVRMTVAAKPPASRP